MKKIFVSRQLDEHSVFYKTLTVNGFTVHGESLLVFEAVPLPTLPTADWVFFYSKTAVQFFPVTAFGAMRVAALGPGTAGALEALGRSPHFVGDGDPMRTAAAFMQVARGRRVLFPRAKESRQSIQQLLTDGVMALDLVVYENAPKTHFQLPDFDVLVFTSPLNATAYFSKKAWKGEAVVAIGTTTAKAIQQLGIWGEVRVAIEPTEAGLAAAVLALNFTK